MISIQSDDNLTNAQIRVFEDEALARAWLDGFQP
jgi:hypothetical protein